VTELLEVQYFYQPVVLPDGSLLAYLPMSDALE